MNMLDGNTAALRAYQNEQDQDDLSHELFGEQVLQDLKYELMTGESIGKIGTKKLDLWYLLSDKDFTDWIVKLVLSHDTLDVAYEIKDAVDKKVDEFLRSDPAAPIIAERVAEYVREA